MKDDPRHSAAKLFRHPPFAIRHKMTHTTKFTSRPGTTTTFLIGWPLTCFCTAPCVLRHDGAVGYGESVLATNAALALQFALATPMLLRWLAPRPALARSP